MKIVAQISFLGASLLMLAAVFYKPLGLSENSDIYFFMGGGVCLVLFYIFQHRARLRGHYAAEAAPRNWLQRTWADRSKRFWLAVAIVAPVAITGPFLAPYTGSTLSFSKEVITSVISFVLFTAILWFLSWRRR